MWPRKSVKSEQSDERQGCRTFRHCSRRGASPTSVSDATSCAFANDVVRASLDEWISYMDLLYIKAISLDVCSNSPRTMSSLKEMSLILEPRVLCRARRAALPLEFEIEAKA